MVRGAASGWNGRWFDTGCWKFFFKRSVSYRSIFWDVHRTRKRRTLQRPKAVPETGTSKNGLSLGRCSRPKVTSYGRLWRTVCYLGSRRPRRWANAQADLDSTPQPMGGAVALSSQQVMPGGSDPKARAEEVKTKPPRCVPSDPIPLKNRFNLLNFVPNNEPTNDSTSTQRVPTSKYKPIVSKKNKRRQGSSPDTHKPKKPLMDGNDADADTSDTDSVDDPLVIENQDVEAEDQEVVGTNDSVRPIVPGQPTGTSQDLEPSVGTPNLDTPVAPFVGQPRNSNKVHKISFFN